MEYQRAKDAYLELKNFEGKATLKGKETVIDLFVLLPKSQVAGIDIGSFIEKYDSSGSFEVEGTHEEEPYTIIGVNLKETAYTNDVDYLLKLLIW